MIRRIKTLFSAPVFEGDFEKTLKARELNNIMNILLIGTTVFTVLLPVFAGGYPPRSYFILPLYLICLGGQWLMRRGHVLVTSRLLAWSIWLSIAAAEVTQGGVEAPAFLGNIVVVLLAAILDGFGSAVLFMVLTLFKGLALIFADQHGLLPPPRAFASLDSINLLTQLFVSTMVIGMLRMATLSIRRSLTYAHHELVERRVVEKSVLQSEQKFRALYETAQKQAQELALEGQVRTAMAGELELETLLRNVVESIADSFGYALVSLYLLEEETMVLQHQVGYEQVIPKIHLSQGVIGRTVRSGEPVLVKDVRSDPDFIGVVENLTSEICIPLFDEGRVVGVLNVESTQDVRLTDSDLKLLTGLGEHVSLAIRHARLYGNIQRRNRIQSALEESTLVLMRRLDLEDVLETFVSHAAQIMDTSNGYIYLVVPDETMLRLTTGTGIFADSVGANLAPHEGLAGKVWMSGQPLNIRHYHDWEGRALQYRTIDFHAVAGVPLTSGARVVGVLGLAYLEPDRMFSDEDIDILSHFSKLASIALENARLYTNIQSELNKQIALRNAGNAISSSLNLGEVLGEICKQMASTIDATSSYIVQYDAKFTAYTVVADYIGPHANDLEKVSDLNTTYYQRDGAKLFDPSKGENYVVLHVQDDNLTPWFRNNLVSFGGKSILQIPLYDQGKLLGHTELWESRKPRDFTGDEIAFCQAISQQAAIAIANARLFEQLQNELAERMRAEQEREHLIAELESKNAELERFAYTISHDLKSPLVTIRGFLGYIEHDAQAGNRDRLKTDLRRVSEATNKMQRLLGELIELTRVGHLRNEPQVIPFADLVQEALGAVRWQLESRGIQVDLQPNLPDVYGDRPRLVEVLQNLIDNAAKYMGDQAKPRIEIGCRDQENGSPIFYLKDNGIGIAPQFHDSIFGLFNKLDADSEGTGMGLAIVKRIIETHGGRIWLESEQGRGATFLFTLGNSLHG